DHISDFLLNLLSGCAWVSPSQWFGGNERCDPDDRSGGLSAACAKESLATQERSSERLVCMGDDTDQAWICGNNMEEVLAQLAERNPTVLAKKKTPSATDTSTDLLPANTEALGISTDANNPQLPQASAPGLDDAKPITASLSQTEKTSHNSSGERQSEPSVGIEATDGDQAIPSRSSEQEQTDAREVALNDVWVFGSFREKSRALRYASELEHNLDKKAHLLESDPQEGSAPWYRVVIKRPETVDERKRLGETIKQIGLESPWRLIVGQVDGQSAPFFPEHRTERGQQNHLADQTIDKRASQPSSEALAHSPGTHLLGADAGAEPSSNAARLTAETSLPKAAANLSSYPSSNFSSYHGPGGSSDAKVLGGKVPLRQRHYDGSSAVLATQRKAMAPEEGSREDSERHELTSVAASTELTSPSNPGGKPLTSSDLPELPDKIGETQADSISAAHRTDQTAPALTAADANEQLDSTLSTSSVERSPRSSFVRDERLTINENAAGMDKQSGALIERASRQAPLIDPVYQQFMDTNPRDFAVQLKAEKALEDIRQYADVSEMTEPTILKIKPFGAPIYVLILDTFSDFELASEAKAAWIASRGDQVEPWIRTVESLQKVIEPMDASDS
ncbi:MAG: hypothetical protein ACPHE1_04085, partial [Pseudomonadales bacterium]